eukprot:467108-Pelagomonas_calceolata.AAC.8
MCHVPLKQNLEPNSCPAPPCMPHLIARRPLSILWIHSHGLLLASVPWIRRPTASPSKRQVSRARWNTLAVQLVLSGCHFVAESTADSSTACCLLDLYWWST